MLGDALACLAAVAQQQPALLIEIFNIGTVEGIGNWSFYNITSTNQLLFRLSDIKSFFYSLQDIPLSDSDLSAFLEGLTQITWKKVSEKLKPVVSVFFSAEKSIYVSQDVLVKLAIVFPCPHLMEVARLSKGNVFKHDFTKLKGFTKSGYVAPIVATLIPLNAL